MSCQPTRHPALLFLPFSLTASPLPLPLYSQLNSLVSEVAQLRQLSTEAVELSSQLSDARSEMMGLSSKASAVQAELDKARSKNIEAEDRIEALHKQVGMVCAPLSSVPQGLMLLM